MIELKDVAKTYELNEHTIEALSNVNLTIQRGEWLAVLGPSGSGKSTLLNCIGGMIQADHGSVTVNDQDLSSMRDDDLQYFRRQTIGFVFQNFRLLPQYTALENVILPQMPYDSSKKLRERAMALMEQFGMQHRLQHLPGELSGGEQQRVALARALMNELPLLLCDEPTGNLDADNRDLILDRLSQLHASGCTIILVTHDPEVAQHAAQEIYLRDGKIQQRVIV